MSVTYQHPYYKAMMSKWDRCRAASAGQDEVHAKGTQFLPKLKDQSMEDYNAYKLRALYYNAVYRTIAGLNGMLFRKEPIIDTQESVTDLLSDVTLGGISFFVFLQQVAKEILTMGRVGVLVDYPDQAVYGMTVADIERLNLRPTMQLYPTETIINWRSERMLNQYALTLVVLTENHTELKDEFEEKNSTHYRVLDLIDGKYRQRVFTGDDNGREPVQVGNDIFPMINGTPLNYIPFIFLGVDDTTPEVDKPPLIDLVDINLAHYRLNADYYHGLHFTGLPTPVVSGYTPDDPSQKLYIGSSAAWTFPDPQAKATYLEYTGQGLAAIEKALEKLEQYMAILGARLLSSEKKATETAQTAQIHRAGEDSILSAIAHTIGVGMSKALNIFAEWASAKSENTIEVNNDFIPVSMTPQELTALVSSWQSGAISHETLFNNLQQGEIISADVTFEDEQGRISATPPFTGGMEQ